MTWEKGGIKRAVLVVDHEVRAEILGQLNGQEGFDY